MKNAKLKDVYKTKRLNEILTKRENTQEIKWYLNGKKIDTFMVKIVNGKVQSRQKFDYLEQSCYILPRNLGIEDDFYKIGIDKCSNCESYFPDGLNECEHCDEMFCCDCADEHSSEISTGGCNF